MRRPLPSASALVVRGQHVLLVKRGREPEPAKWSLPAGLVELGEKAEEAAVRETYEETGILVAVEALLGVYDLIEKSHHYIIICFSCRPIGGELRPGPDVEAARWFRLGELGRIELMSVTKEALRDAGILP
mgnify:CR=1 FL=1